MKVDCYIFDIDGTLADGSHRIHHIVRTDGAPKDWDTYFSLLSEDALIPHMARVARSLSLYTDIVYVSGRPAEYWSETLAWLRKHDLPPGRLFCRPLGDRRDDHIVKIELLEVIRAEGFNPIMAFDDRTRVVEAWRAAGIPCVQVAPGDF